MTGNTTYPTPAPALTIVTTAINAFTVAIANAADGGKELTSIKNAKRVELISLLRQLASYVGVTCDSDMTKLLSSGFPVQKPNRTPAVVPPAPVTPLVSQGVRTGELNASTTPVVGAYIYNWRLALAASPSSYVQTAQTTGARNTFDALTAGAIYNVELNAVGTAGASDWSTAADLMVV